MSEQGRAKKFLLGGAIVGGIMSLSVSLLMDSLFSDAMQGTWRDAIAKDLNAMLSIGVTSKSLIVGILFLVILAFLAAFGAFMGYIFSFFIYKFFSFLGRQ